MWPYNCEFKCAMQGIIYRNQKYAQRELFLSHVIFCNLCSRGDLGYRLPYRLSLNGNRG